jgi:hypothetical protein
MQRLKLLIVGLALAANFGATAEEPFALIELFTSEGCSSCPPADRLGAKLVERAAADDQNVYVLSFHVDYWDRLGWKDPYSSKAATDRQRAYQETLRERTIYTPQMVVNGAVGFVGSDLQRAEQEIEKALEREAPLQVEAEAETVDGDTLRVDVEVSTEHELLHRDWDVVAAVVERGLSQNPDRGENKGRTLKHENVVRVFGVEPLAHDRASVSLVVLGDVDRNKSSIIVYAQDRRTRKILGVIRVEFPLNE